MNDFPITRRELLQRTSLGFGGLALHSLLADEANSALQRSPMHTTHFQPRAKRILFLFMHGGPSHIDLFDPKPQLTKYDGKPLPFKGSRVVFAKRGNLMKSPWRFRKHGDGGIPMCELWQHLPQVADELCMVHSLCETNVAHGGACMKLHMGVDNQIRPSMGSWVSYGLGSENQNLPSFVTSCPSSLHGGINNFGSAFLPAEHQGVPYGTPGYPNTLSKDAKFKHMTARRTTRQQRAQLDLLHSLQDLRGNKDKRLEARIRSYELAFRMQQAAPEAVDLSQETQSTRQLYGLDEEPTSNFARQCILARRFLERGVRFVQVSHSHSLPYNNEQWDQHTHLVRGHATNVKQIDKPIAGLITDLRQRGLLDDTLVIWGGEFGRTPTMQESKSEVGRDHHPEGFTMWFAGAGVKGGTRYGTTDEFGYFAEENRCTIHDLHATLLYALGLDHTQLTYMQSGREFRLTDVEGEVAHGVFS